MENTFCNVFRGSRYSHSILRVQMVKKTLWKQKFSENICYALLTSEPPPSPPPFLSSDVDHIRLVHVTNWSSRCPWPLSPNSPASQSSDVLLGTTLGTDFVISCSKVNISVSLIICVNISAETIATGFAECNLYESMASPIQKNSSST